MLLLIAYDLRNRDKSSVQRNGGGRRRASQPRRYVLARRGGTIQAHREERGGGRAWQALRRTPAFMKAGMECDSRLSVGIRGASLRQPDARSRLWSRLLRRFLGRR